MTARNERPQAANPDDDLGAAPVIELLDFFFVVVSRGSDCFPEILRRFGLEFGLRAAPQPMETDTPRGGRMLFAALEPRADADRLAGWQQHANRVSHLFAAASGTGSLSIHFGHASPTKITVAFDRDAAGRVCIRRGVWGAILAERGAAGEAWEWNPREGMIPEDARIADFFNLLAGGSHA